MIKILALRQQAIDQLGDQFDIKEFHNVILGNGAVPLEILERIVDDWIKEDFSIPPAASVSLPPDFAPGPVSFQEPVAIGPDTVDQVKRLHILRGHTDRVDGLDFSSDGELLASWGDDGALKLWSTESWWEVGTFNDRGGSWRVAFSPDDALLASGSGRVWDAASGQQVHTVNPGHTGTVALAFSPDGALLASTVDTGPTIKLWSVGDWQIVGTLEKHSEVVYSLAFSPDGTLLAAGGTGIGPAGVLEYTVRLWDVREPQSVDLDSVELHILNEHWGDVHEIAFSPDGALLASGSTDETVKVWDVQSGRLIHTLGQGNGLNSVAFSPDGALLASAGAGRRLKLWEVASGRPLRTFTHADEIMAVAFAPDGSLLASGGYDNAVYLWGIPHGEE
jgi:WD40 repeat protein